MVLLRAADLMEGRAEEFTKLMMSEAGATRRVGRVHVYLAASMLREAASDDHSDHR